MTAFHQYKQKFPMMSYSPRVRRPRRAAIEIINDHLQDFQSLPQTLQACSLKAETSEILGLLAGIAKV
jgi:hypothetical protein